MSGVEGDGDALFVRLRRVDEQVEVASTCTERPWAGVLYESVAKGGTGQQDSTAMQWADTYMGKHCDMVQGSRKALRCRKHAAGKPAIRV